MWKYFYFDLLRFNFSCCVFRVRNSLEFKYNPQKCLIDNKICFVINTITHIKILSYLK